MFNDIEFNPLPVDSVCLEWCLSFVPLKKTGQMVVSQKKNNKGPWSLFLLTLGEEGLIEKRIKSPCKHAVHLLNIPVKGQEHIALCCVKCGAFKIMNISKSIGEDSSDHSDEIKYEISSAFDKVLVHRICQGELNRLYVLSKSDKIIELNTSTVPFKEVDRSSIRTKIKSNLYRDLCYVPDPHKIIIVSDGITVHGISCDSKKIIWTLEDRVDGRKIDLHDLLYLPDRQIALVADGENRRVLVLDPISGSHRQTIELPGDWGEIKRLCIQGNQVVLLDVSDHGAKISFFSLRQKQVRDSEACCQSYKHVTV